MKTMIDDDLNYSGLHSTFKWRITIPWRFPYPMEPIQHLQRWSLSQRLSQNSMTFCSASTCIWSYPQMASHKQYIPWRTCLRSTIPRVTVCGRIGSDHLLHRTSFVRGISLGQSTWLPSWAGIRLKTPSNYHYSLGSPQRGDSSSESSSPLMLVAVYCCLRRFLIWASSITDLTRPCMGEFRSYSFNTKINTNINPPFFRMSGSSNVSSFPPWCVASAVRQDQIQAMVLSNSALLTMPIPDLSMPYNVITLVINFNYAVYVSTYTCFMPPYQCTANIPKHLILCRVYICMYANISTFKWCLCC